MADGGILDGLDKATGGDGDKAGAKGKKGKKKTKPIVIVAGVGAAVLVYYLYSKHQANTAATSATNSSAIDPTTGVPYADETGSNAIDPSTGVPYSSEVGTGGTGVTSTGSASATDPFQAVDPTSASGETYAQELGANTSDLSTLTQDVGALQDTVATTQNSQSALQSSWETGLYSALTQAGITGDQAAQDVQNYLNGQPLQSSAAVSAINGYVGSAGASPSPGGSSLVAVLANGAKQVTGTTTGGTSSTGSGQPVGNTTFKAPGIVTNPNGSTDAAAVASLSAANAKLKSEQATGNAKAVAAARANAQNAAKVVEARNKAAK